MYTLQYLPNTLGMSHTTQKCITPLGCADFDARRLFCYLSVKGGNLHCTCNENELFSALCRRHLLPGS